MAKERRFRLRSATVAVEGSESNRVAVTIPAGDIVKVISERTSHRDGMIEVLWDTRVLKMFAVDLEKRGEAIDKSPTG